MRARTSVAVVLVAFAPTLVCAQGRGHGGGAAPRGHGGVPPAHARGKAAGPQGNGQGKAHGGAAGQGQGQGHGRRTAAAHLATRPELRATLQQRLPAGTDINAAADGFDSLGRFVAAVTVSKNLDIPFDQLKARTTGDKAVSLGRAIQELRPDAKGGSEAKRAEREARDMISGRR
jgi:hypothetical protein